MRRGLAAKSGKIRILRLILIMKFRCSCGEMGFIPLPPQQDFPANIQSPSEMSLVAFVPSFPSAMVSDNYHMSSVFRPLPTPKCDQELIIKWRKMEWNRTSKFAQLLFKLACCQCNQLELKQKSKVLKMELVLKNLIWCRDQTLKTVNKKN